MTAEPDPRMVAGRVERLLEQLRGSPDPRAAKVAEELVGCLVRLYGAGLERIVAMVGPHRSPELCADPLVESLMLVHDLHPLDAEARIRRALDRLGPAAGEVRFDGIDAAGVVRVHLAGGHGCRSSARAAVASALRDAAPEVTGVEVDVTPVPPPLLHITRRPAPGAV